MRHQQRLWRHLKDARRREEGGGGGGRGDVMLVDAAIVGGGGGGGGCGASSKQQKCDMCRNHGEMREKRAHKNACPFQNCDCALCGLTRKRRDIMRHQQRVRRSQVIASQQSTQVKDEAYAYVIQATRELALDTTLNNPAGLLPSIDTTFGISQGLLPSSSSQQQQQQGGGGQAKDHLKDTGSSSSSSSSSPPPPPPLPSSSSSGPPPPSTPSLSITTSPTLHSLSLSTSPSASCRSSPVLPSTCSSLCDSQPLDSLALSDHHLDSHSMDLDLDLRKLHQFTSPSSVAKGTVVGGGVGGSGVWRNLKRQREEMLGSRGGSVGCSSSSGSGSGGGCGSFGGIGSSLSAALPLVLDGGGGGGDFAGYGGVGGGGGRELVLGSSSSCSSPSSCLPHPSLPPSPVPSITSNSPIVCHKKTRLFSTTQDHQHLPLPYNSSAFWPTAHNPLDAFTNPPFTHTAYSRHLASAGISSAGLSSAGLSSTGPTLTSASLHAPNRIRSPPGLIPLPTHQQPIRPRPIPLPRHPTALTPGMTDWDSVSLPYLAYSLLHTRALPPTHLGLGTVRHFFPPSVP
ncbi:hypothetical protein Pmani_002663 [Petrolisthes manimaculis]|uniref:DM domain-containing protein n=1 Tax=Petrolisthes manimaculis TaxID=1843537 RepID=A0AAE1QI24_9EUCA|nr:hypothetical protein Pmani_002663 [Petrolisthes manimaculis]